MHLFNEFNLYDILEPWRFKLSSGVFDGMITCSAHCRSSQLVKARQIHMTQTISYLNNMTNKEMSSFNLNLNLVFKWCSVEATVKLNQYHIATWDQML